MTKILDEVLAANATKATCPSPRAVISRSSLVWMPASIRRSMPVCPKAMPM